MGDRTTINTGFNPRTHAGCDRGAVVPAELCTVSIHAPTRGATMFYRTVRNIHLVSIHAPTRGATSLVFKSPFSIGVSIHAPTRGATKTNRVTSLLAKFQSTHPRGVRHPAFRDRDWSIDVSIHAPTRGATDKSLNDVIVGKVSIHAPTRGATGNSLVIHVIQCFNPRTHAGCDWER